MYLGAQICEASARDAFHIELDQSLTSLVWLDDLIAQAGWNEREAMPQKARFTITAYLGEVFVRGHNARWTAGARPSELPFLEFPASRVIANLSEMIDRKLRDMSSVSLAQIGSELLEVVEERSRGMRHTPRGETVYFHPLMDEDTDAAAL